MNIKVAAFTVSERSINTPQLFQDQLFPFTFLNVRWFSLTFFHSGYLQTGTFANSKNPE